MTSDPEKMRRWSAEDRVHFGDDETAVPCFKSYLADREEQVPYSVFYRDGRAATKRLRRLMGGDCFDFPKDEEVLRELVAMVTDPGDLVLDFFAGSGSTGHAVLAQNALGEGDRHFLLVQSPEPLDPANKGQRNAAAYCDRLGKPRTIAELAKERLRRAGRAVAQDATRPGRARSSGENGALRSEGADCTEKREAAESGGERALQDFGAPPDWASASTSSNRAKGAARKTRDRFLTATSALPWVLPFPFRFPFAHSFSRPKSPDSWPISSQGSLQVAFESGRMSQGSAACTGLHGLFGFEGPCHW
jgi:hypothetical protein